jgi:hypothetical protein
MSTTPRSAEITPATFASKSRISPPMVATRSSDGFEPSSFSMFELASASASRFEMSSPASMAAYSDISTVNNIGRN